LRAVALVALAACSHGDPAPKPSEPLPWAPLHGFMQEPRSTLLTAVADDWTSTNVTITYWEPASTAMGTIPGGWRRVRGPWNGVIGGAGLAWGDGLHGIGAPQGHDGPVKREGDNKSPAGAFRISRSFGYEPDDGSPNYMQLTDKTECVDDPKSAAYNTIVEHTGSADWTSSEHMRRADDLYSIGLVVDHNTQRTPGHGSCIFLHVWSGPDSTTVGCTAMGKDDLEELHLVGSTTVFVQLPRAEYRALQDQWGLPPQ
jgi:D-alanyl-D-alanine dipeptidase